MAKALTVDVRHPGKELLAEVEGIAQNPAGTPEVKCSLSRRPRQSES